MKKILIPLLSLVAAHAWSQGGLKDIPDPSVEAQLAGFKVPEGMEINLFASDPMISKPVQMNWDSEGRLWLVSSNLYPHIEPGQEENDKVYVLEDEDKDGVADKATTFAEGLHIPTAVIPGDGGAYVANSTEILFMRDIDGDLKADERRVVLSGFGTEDTHHLIHTFRHGPDGMLYFNQSIYIHSHVETPHGVRRLMGGGIWHYRPETQRLEILAKGLINPWGFRFDKYGQTFATDGAGFEGIHFVFPRAVYRTSPGAVRIVPGLNPGQPKHCGLEILNGRHIPGEMQGQLLAPDFRGHRINRFKLEEKGSYYESIQQEDILASTHRAFRPIDVKVGPDGAIYIADWYNPIIQHGEVDFRDPRRDHTHGRIWRLTFKDRDLLEKPDYENATIPALFDMLDAPEELTRHFAKRELRHRGADEVLPELDKWSANLDSDRLRLEALWTYQSLNRVNADLLERLFASEDHHYRAAALRVLYHRHAEVPRTEAILKKAVHDSHPQVRLWAISCLAQIPKAESVALALETLDQEVDEMIDFALWSIVREHQNHWVPAYEDGKLDLEIPELIFAVRALERPLALERVFTSLETGKLQEEEVADAIEIIGKVGSPSDLQRLLRIAIAKGNHVAKVLDVLTEAKRVRKLQPAEGLAQVVDLLHHTNREIVNRAAVLAGLWKVETARPELEAFLKQPGTPEATFEAAAEGLRLLGGGETLNILEDLAKNSDSNRTRVIALTELAKANPQRAGSTAVTVLSDSDTKAAAGIFDTFIRNPKSTAALVKALDGKKLPRNVAIAGVQRAGTAGNPPENLIQALRKAGGIKSMTQQLSAEEMERLMAQVEKNGNPHRGEAIYRRQELQCMVCHAIGGVGGKIGPDLVSIGSSAPVDYLIESLLEPNKKIKEGYHTTLVITKSGEAYTGGINSETDQELVLRDNTGALHRIPKADIKSVQTSPVSMMPPGLVAGLREDEFVDLVSFLSELGKEGEFKMSPKPVIREWRALQPHERTRDDIGHYGPKIFAEDFEGYEWTPAYSMVSGELPPGDLPKVKGRGSYWGVVRFTLEDEGAWEKSLKINDTKLMHLFRGEEEIELPEKGQAEVKVAGNGEQQFTIAVKSQWRPQPILVEVTGTEDASAGKLSFRAQQLYKDNIEGIDVGDIDKDGDLDVVAGERWYSNPEWKPIKFREIEPFGKDYMQDNGDHLLDLNGDGWLDVLSGQFTKSVVYWFENPGEKGPENGSMWKQHELVDTGTGQNEMTFLYDINDDGKVEYFENSWNDNNPMLIWSIVSEDGKPTTVKSIAGKLANGHGQGFGDIDGDGDDDIVFKQGWYENPGEEKALQQTWELHKHMTLPHASCPILVLDVNGDGRNDLIWGDGHNYGLFWDEQLEPRDDGTTLWKRHTIDKSFSQAHALAWEDIDNDGAPELITGKRYYAHSGRDPGAEDEIVINYYKWRDGKGSFDKFEAHKGQAGTGLQIRVADLNEDGWKEIIVPGKSGTHILWNEGLKP